MPSRSSMGWAFAVVTMVATLLGACTGTELTPTSTTDPTATTTSTTEPKTAPVFVPGEIDFSEVAAGESTIPVQLVHTGDRLWLLSDAHSSAPNLWGNRLPLQGDAGSSATTLLSTSDGSSWEEVSVPFDDGTRVTATSGGVDGLTLATVDPDGVSSLWKSTDGREWEQTVIPADEIEGVTEFVPTAVGDDDFVTVVSGISIPAFDTVIGDPIRASLWPNFDPNRYGLNVQPLPNELKIDVLGPLGLKLIVTSASELGLSREVTTQLRENNTPVLGTWSYSEEFDDWERVDVGNNGVLESVVTLEDAVYGVGHTPIGGLTLWRSFDGIGWEQLPGMSSFRLFAWGEKLVGTEASSRPELLSWAPGDEQWEPLGISDYVPSAQSWFIDSVDASQDGLVVSLATVTREDQSAEIPPVPVIEKDGVQISVDYENFGQVRMTAGEEEYIWASSVDYGPDRLRFDPETETITFFREDATELVSITLEELEPLSPSFLGPPANMNLEFDRMVLYTEDSTNWKVFEPELEEGAFVRHASVIDNTIVLVITSPFEQEGFRIWAADLD